MLTVERIRNVLLYSPEIGRWTWLIALSRRVKVGSEAGCVCSNGYRYISVDGKLYTSASLAVFYMTGEWPPEDVDHVNRVRDDDRWCNLRPATRGQNMANTPARRDNALGVKGVHKHGLKYRATLRGKIVGAYGTVAEAKAAYDAAAESVYGEFARA